MIHALLPLTALLAACGGGGGDEQMMMTSPDAGATTPRDAAPMGDARPALPVGMLVSSRGGSVVLAFDGSGASAGTFAADPKLISPVGITYGPDGNLYVAVGDSDRVVRFDGATGAFMDVFTHGVTLMSPRNLNFGPDGAFYVADGFLNKILKFDGTSGAFIKDFVADPALNGPTSFTFGPDGNVYVVSVLTNSVLQFDGTTGALIKPFATTSLRFPHDVSFGPDGNLYVTNSNGTTIETFDGASGSSLSSFASDRKLSLALGMAWGPDGNLYIANQGGNEVRIYEWPTGASLGAFVSPGTGGLNGPAFLLFRPAAALSLTSLATGDLYVVAGARPGARVLVARGTSGGSGSLTACPALTLSLGAPAVAGTIVADESGGGVIAIRGAPAGAAFAAVDTARCMAAYAGASR